MPSATIDSPDSALAYLGVFLFVIGVFITLAGFGILSVEKVTIKPGRATCTTGLILMIVGILSLVLQIVNWPPVDSTANIPPTAIPNPQPTNTSAPNLIATEPATTQSTPTPVPTQSYDAAQAVREYYRAINNREYSATWMMLSQHYKDIYNSPERGGFEAYVQWWNTVENVTVVQADVVRHDNNIITVHAPLLYRMKVGKVIPDVSPCFELAYDSVSSKWQIYEKKKPPCQ